MGYAFYETSFNDPTVKHVYICFEIAFNDQTVKLVCIYFEITYAKNQKKKNIQRSSNRTKLFNSYK
ncbi:hypothetical protein DVH24_013453 [Malus domestica]|uniref:Uncharacterized protein n=1 Tax=Malus domestica TaxID=3750 RepID=A0A498HMS7_MALDO|nr:hypothetical protein DVH24_013453 [Malus domestica]